MRVMVNSSIGVFNIGYSRIVATVYLKIYHYREQRKAEGQAQT